MSSYLQFFQEKFRECIFSEPIGIELKDSSELQDDELRACLDILDTNLGSLYRKHHGSNWKTGKLIEMTENGLIYVLLRPEVPSSNSRTSPDLAGFSSFMVTPENGKETIYLYEIQISPKYQQKGHGKVLMDTLFRSGAALKSQLKPELSSLMLTVFSDNRLAFDWYLKQGFAYATHSPMDTQLRSGRLLKPSYYILEKEFP